MNNAPMLGVTNASWACTHCMSHREQRKDVARGRRKEKRATQQVVDEEMAEPDPYDEHIPFHCCCSYCEGDYWREDCPVPSRVDAEGRPSWRFD